MVSCLAQSTTKRETTIVYRVITISLMVIFGVLYLMQMSTASTKGYDISALRREIQLLENENRKLAVEIAKHSSLSSVESRLAALNLVVVDQVDYLSSASNIVARR